MSKPIDFIKKPFKFELVQPCPHIVYINREIIINRKHIVKHEYVCKNGLYPDSSIAASEECNCGDYLNCQIRDQSLISENNKWK